MPTFFFSPDQVENEKLSNMTSLFSLYSVQVAISEKAENICQN